MSEELITSQMMENWRILINSSNENDKELSWNLITDKTIDMFDINEILKHVHSMPARVLILIKYYMRDRGENFKILDVL